MPDSSPTSLRIPKRLLDVLDQMAAIEGTTRARLIKRALIDYIAANIAGRLATRLPSPPRAVKSKKQRVTMYLNRDPLSGASLSRD